MKSLIAAFLTITCLMSSINVTGGLLTDRPNGGIRQGLAMYCQPRDSIDVVMLGSSHVNYGINTAKIWEDYGISAYDYSSAEQAIWISYYYLREICKYQKPKVVVLDFFAPAAFLDGYADKYYYLQDAFCGFRYSMNKVEMVNTAVDGDEELKKKYIYSYYSPENSDDLTALKDGWGKDYSSFKGYTPSFKQAPVETPVPNTTDVKAPSEKSQKYLRKIIDYTYKNGIQLYITIVPYHLNVGQQEGVTQEEDLRYNWLENYLAGIKDEGIDNIYFDYTFKHIGDLGIDYEGGTHFADGSSHLNYYGSTQFAKYLAEDLRNRYGAELLPDHRGDSAYSSWDVNVSELKEQVSSEGWEWR
ncbi:hypothetical protein [Butyrivibrio sp. VCD2006]|uniref:hypothetical protein n=1 Tax=Butyrivibrio sp. VCD2006 TaxID=1280664 RepID=UPI00041632F0|nr:hypothetical protein [Butyrivibrio sp. VCD2006]